MIKYVVGDLIKMGLNGDFDVICHGANCFCTFGSGIALQIKNTFPEAYEVDCKTKKGAISKLGGISFTTNTKPVVVNCYTQFDYRGRLVGIMDCDYNAIIKSLIEVKKQFTGKRIGLPRIGCGLASGDFNVVKRIIEDILSDEDVTVVEYDIKLSTTEKNINNGRN